MMRSMNSAVSALRAHQSKMDVIGNNIANVNTVGFKGSRVTFKEVLSQTISGASASQGGRSGTNPQQIGLGTSIGTIDTIHTQGTPDVTDAPSDVMINGDGYFIVSDDADFLNRSYTRAGNFTLDDNGNLNLGGYRVLGYRVDEETIGEDPKYRTQLEGLVISKAATFPAQVTGVSKAAADEQSKERDVVVEGNINADLGLNAEVTAKDTTGDGSVDEWSVPADKLKTDPYFVTVYDELGGEHELKLTFRRKFQSGFDYNWGNDKFNTQSFPVPIDDPHIEDAILPNEWELVLEPVNSTELINDGTGATSLIKTDVTFTNGKVDLSKLNIEFSQDGASSFPNGAGVFNFNLSFKDDNGDSLLSQFSSDDSVIHTNALRGYKQGSLYGYSIGEDGVITGYFSNGKKSAVGRLALANFKNPEGLQKTQDNLFVNTSNSGTPIIGKPGSAGFSNVMSGRLEMSNVDLSKEFTTMITTQRGFQANSRVITTTDEMLQELVNLKR